MDPLSLGMGLFGGIFSTIAGRQSDALAKADLRKQWEADGKIAADSLALQKDQALKGATELERTSRAGFSLAMGDLFVQQKQGTAGLQNLQADNARALSAQDAGAGLSGVRNNGTTAILDTQAHAGAAGQEGLAKNVLESGITSTAGRASLGLSADLNRASQARADFDPGSAFMTLFNTKKAAADAAYQREYASYDGSLLKDATRFFGGASSGYQAGASIYDNGKKAGWWDQPTPAVAQ